MGVSNRSVVARASLTDTWHRIDEHVGQQSEELKKSQHGPSLSQGRSEERVIPPSGHKFTSVVATESASKTESEAAADFQVAPPSMPGVPGSLNSGEPDSTHREPVALTSESTVN